jgi:hypothetical protein
MPPVRAVIITRTAPLHSEFGFSYATRLFGEETIASLPLYVRGPHKGEVKGWLVWLKAESGGWAERYGVVRPGLVAARITAVAHGETPLRGTWMGRTEDLSGAAAVLTEAYRQQTLRERAEEAARRSETAARPTVRMIPMLGAVT